MGMVVPLILQLVKLCIIGLAYTVLGSTGHDVPPSPSNFSVISPVEGTPGLIHHRKFLSSDAPSSVFEANGSDVKPPHAIPSHASTPMPQIIEGLAPSLSPTTPIELPPQNTAHPPLTSNGQVPSLSPIPPLLSPPFSLDPPLSASPTTPVISAQPDTTPPPSSSLVTPVISPPPNTTPPFLTPRVPAVSPSANMSPPSSLMPTTPAVSPQSSTPKDPIVSPPSYSAPPPSTRTNPRVSPPPSSAPPPSSTRTNPIVSPPHSSAPPPSSTRTNPIASPPSSSAPPPSSTRANPMVSPPSYLAPPPSSKRASPIVSPPSYSAPPPTSTPINPVVSPPSYTAPPPPSMPTNPIVSPPSYSAPPPSSMPTNPRVSPPSNLSPPLSNSAPPPFNIEGLAPSTVPSAPPRKGAVRKNNDSFPGAPVASSPTNEPQISPSSPPNIPGALPPFIHERNASRNKAPIMEPVTPDLDAPSASTPASSFDGIPVAEPPHEVPKPLPPMSHSPTNGHSDDHLPPLSSPISPPNNGSHSHASSPSTSFPKHHNASNKVASPAPASSYSPTVSTQGPVVHPGIGNHAPPPLHPGSSMSPAPSPTATAASSQTEMPLLSPKISPSGPSTKSPKMPVLPPIRALPPPPPNADCSTTVCREPYTNTPPGAPCGCVWPMQVGLRLSVALYTFFPLVSELAVEIAAGVFMKQSQVRIMGANAASQQPEKTVVLVDLVPLGEKFDNTTAFLTYQRFWHKQVVIQSSFFGDYEVLYVRYPGLPPSPPSASSDIDIIDGPYSGSGNNARTMKPEGVDVPKKRQGLGPNHGVVAIIVLSAFVAVILCCAVAWVLLFKYRGRVCQSEPAPGPLQQSHAKPSGAAGSMAGSGLESTSLSFGSSIAAYTGSAKTFSTSDIERATAKFDASRILGEGGFGRVYSGVLEDGTKVAVKVLKRDDQQGGREFLAEVEMLSRLHHRNLVKLIGICIEEQARCLVYELIPNGSVESHLHGFDKESAPLGWDARLKIALGAARGLAYLHEDSSPRVIHRDFKSSNILLENDFTPKVSDFGLARTALDGENTHISTRVMGTFGYVAPEYAMTGHLLVKSDVYSYGVVLLELLTGRKPVDMTQLPGQENLVAWARPLLSSSEGLEAIIDSSLGDDIPFDSVAKVAAIASMCVQPEVSHRPFMGEVVQALKLVCNECNEAREVGSRSSSQDDLSIDFDARVSNSSGQLPDPLQSQHSVHNYDMGLDTERGLPVSDLFSSSARYGKDESESFRRYSTSGPLRTGRGRQFWQNIRRLSTGSVSEHGSAMRLWPGSH